MSTSRRTCPPKLARRSAGAKEDAAYPWLLDGPPSHLFCLAPEGVFRAADVTIGAVGSYSTFSPLLRTEWQVAVARDECFPPPLAPCFSPLKPRSGLFSVTLVRRRALTRAARACGEACAASCPAVSGLSSPNFYRARVSPHLGIKELGATTRPQS